MEAINPKRQVKRGQFAEGAFTVAFGAVCAGSDIYNNSIFGWDKSPAIAIAFVAAGFALAILPGLAKGWNDLQVWSIVAACGGLCLFAGYQNHMASQRNHDLAEKAITERYEGAQRAIAAAQDDYEAAKRDVADAKELSGSEELRVALAAATKLYDDNKTMCGPVCKQARADIQTLPDRIGKAKAREDAQTRMSAALSRMNDEKARAPKQAKASGASSEEETLMAILLLVFTVIGATMTHRGWDRVKTAFVEVPAPKVKKPAPAKKAEPAPIEPSETGEGIDDFIGRAVTAATCEPYDGEETVSAAKAYDLFQTWWHSECKGRSVPKPKAFGDAMTKAGVKRKKVKGKIHYRAKLGTKHLILMKSA